MADVGGIAGDRLKSFIERIKADGISRVQWQLACAADVSLDDARRAIAIGLIDPDKAVQVLATAPKAHRIGRGTVMNYKPGQSTVYFINCPLAGVTKIGVTLSLAERLTALRYGSPAPLILLAAMPGNAIVEAEHHSRFASLRSHGEWFRHEEPLIGYIAEIDARLAA